MTRKSVSYSPQSHFKLCRGNFQNDVMPPPPQNMGHLLSAGHKEVISGHSCVTYKQASNKRAIKCTPLQLFNENRSIYSFPFSFLCLYLPTALEMRHSIQFTKPILSNDSCESTLSRCSPGSITKRFETAE